MHICSKLSKMIVDFSFTCIDVCANESRVTICPFSLFSFSLLLTCSLQSSYIIHICIALTVLYRPHFFTLHDCWKYTMFEWYWLKYLSVITFCKSLSTLGKQSQNTDILGNLEIQGRTCSGKSKRMITLMKNTMRKTALKVAYQLAML